LEGRTGIGASKKQECKMIGYVMAGTNKLDEAAEFYDALFSTIGAARAYDTDTFIAWGTGLSAPAFSITKPHDECVLFQS